MNKILLVEDDKDIQEINKYMLDERGYNVSLAMNLTEARQCITQFAPDLIVLDIMLPDGSGLDFMEELRKHGNSIPILLLTALSTPKDKVEGLRRGGNDYLAKPYDYDEFVMRIEVMLRSKQQENERVRLAVEAAEQNKEVLTFGGLTLNNTARNAYVNGKLLNLTQMQVGLLLLLARHKNETLTYAYLYETIWGQPLVDDSQALRSAIAKIRNEIAGCGYSLSSERGIGYRFEQGEYR
ncbi:MAG: response regulator transcription factor [Defluviitaleaceae bacterium]|nr:response regulator transcription factor [Defluviitaleaceae bacterium]MCL2239779.1 response regulator transcription factor [Defluviitaleaceae bacterium]